MLAQAVHSSELEKKRSKEKDKKKKSKDGVQKLVELLQGKKKKKKRKDRERKRRRAKEEDDEDSQGGAPLRARVKRDPGGPGSSGSDDSSGSSSSSPPGKKGSGSESDAALSYEPPGRRKAAKEPGSVMAMLVRHAQDQLDRGALMEQEGQQPGITSGIKISTYFALLIRPYYSKNSPLLRELYALANTIDLLRSGKLAESADALASRFIAVHTALAEGGCMVNCGPVGDVPSGADAVSHSGFFSGAKACNPTGGVRVARAVAKATPGTKKARKVARKGKEKAKDEVRERTHPSRRRAIQTPGKRTGRQQQEMSSAEKRADGGFTLQPLKGIDGALAQAVLRPLHEGCYFEIFRQLSKCGHSYDTLGRGLLWVLLTVPFVEKRWSVSKVACQAIMGKRAGPYAVHRDRSKRNRSLFPLPLGTVNEWSRLAKESCLEEFTGPQFAGSSTDEIWLGLAIMSLNLVAGCGRAIPDRTPTLVQERALKSVYLYTDPGFAGQTSNCKKWEAWSSSKKIDGQRYALTMNIQSSSSG
eukprot:s114_g8.t1